MICFNSPCGFAVSHCFFSLSEFSNATLFSFFNYFLSFFFSFKDMAPLCSVVVEIDCNFKWHGR